jgi:hypothetical protein
VVDNFDKLNKKIKHDEGISICGGKCCQRLHTELIFSDKKQYFYK